MKIIITADIILVSGYAPDDIAPCKSRTDNPGKNQSGATK